LREAIDQFVHNAIRCNENGERGQGADVLQNDALHPEDWELLRCVMELLEPFKKFTLKLQGRYSNGCIADILPAMGGRLFGLEAAKIHYEKPGEFHSPELVMMINNAWDTLNREAD
jgi:hypothetical protein